MIGNLFLFFRWKRHIYNSFQFQRNIYILNLWNTTGLIFRFFVTPVHRDEGMKKYKALRGRRHWADDGAAVSLSSELPSEICTRFLPSAVNINTCLGLACNSLFVPVFSCFFLPLGSGLTLCNLLRPGVFSTFRSTGVSSQTACYLVNSAL